MTLSADRATPMVVSQRDLVPESRAGMGLFSRFESALDLEDHEADFLSIVRDAVRTRIAPRAETLDQTGVFPSENMDVLHALGLNSVFVPEQYGGTPTSYSFYLRLVEEVSRGCPATAITWAATYHAISPIIHVGTAAQRERYLPRIAAGGYAALAITEANAGSDVRRMTMRLRPDGDAVVIDGQKVFITNGDVADVLVVFGKWTEIADLPNSVSAILVDSATPGLSVLRREDKMGTRASSTVALSFDNCCVPRSNLLGDPGDGFQVLVAALNKSRPSIAAHALGIARTAFEEAVAYANDRQQFNREILSFQGVQFMVADIASRLAMVESWLAHVGKLVDTGCENYDIEASLLKVAASDLANDAATMAVQLHGGAGYIRGSKVERLYRDAKLTQIWEGANELHRDRIGRSFLAKRPDSSG